MILALERAIENCGGWRCNSAAPGIEISCLGAGVNPPLSGFGGLGRARPPKASFGIFEPVALAVGFDVSTDLIAVVVTDLNLIPKECPRLP